jgi:DNA-binding IclR family transcriptional regulator
LKTKIRSSGISAADGTQLASVNALSAPIFDVDSRMVAATVQGEAWRNASV